MKTLNLMCVVLAVFGAINWTFLGLFNKDAVSLTMGETRSVGTDVLHVLVAMAAVGMLVAAFTKGK